MILYASPEPGVYIAINEEPPRYIIQADSKDKLELKIDKINRLWHQALKERENSRYSYLIEDR